MKIFFVSILLVAILIVKVYADEGADSSQTVDHCSSIGGSAIVIKDIAVYANCKDEECIKQQHLGTLNQIYDVYLPYTYGNEDTDWKLEQQSILECGDKKYAEINIRLLNSNEIKTVFFDITDAANNFKKALADIGSTTEEK